MTHPSADEVALHLEGLLPPVDERRVGDHLRECADCAATARDLGAVPEALRAAAAAQTTTPAPMPADVARRIEAALAQEPGPVRGAEVASLDDRRRRRRRVLGGGLLAAAAATVVAVGLGELVQTGGSGEAASGGAQQESAVAGDPPPGQSATRPTRRPQKGRDAASTGGGAAPNAVPHEAKLQARAFSPAVRSGLTGLVDGVAAAHDPARPRHDRDACVRTALGLAAGGDAPASYAVPLPGRGGPVPGVVVLRPVEAPTQGLVVSCGPRPRVLLSRGLDR